MFRPVVLIVDHCLDARAQVRAILENLGADCLDAEEGFEALQFAGVRIDLVITEIDLPGMDGLALFRHIQDGGLGAPAPPVIFFSDLVDGVLFQGRSELARSAGAIRKPLNPDHLRLLVGPLLTQRTAEP